MKNLESFQQFGLGGAKLIASDNRRCVLYTRVSTAEQEDNTSLENQIQTCRRFAEKNGFEIIEEFGGKGESAKTGSARKEYERMLKFVRSKSNKIRYVVFYSYDRFSREGGKAIVDKEDLKKMGILIKSASMPIDTDSPMGSAMEDFQLLWGKLDNDVRRSKCIDGMISTLKKGKWCGMAPIGYRWDKNKGMLVVDEVKGPLIRKAFQWRHDEPGITSEEIRARLKKLGLDIPRQTMSKLFRNPIYCGLIAHSLTPGLVFQGQHEAILDHKIFLEVNEAIRGKNKSGWMVNEENIHLALKRFMMCDECGTPLTGYIVQKKGIHYYKCRKKGCGTNKNAESLDGLFLTELKNYHIENELIPLIQMEMREAAMEKIPAVLEEESQMQKSLTDIDATMKAMRKKLIVEGSITRTEHDEFAIPLNAEKTKIEKKLLEMREMSSNLLDQFENCIWVAAKLAVVWEKGGYRTRQIIQSMAFPNGMSYDKKNDAVRTEKVNDIVTRSSDLGPKLVENKSGRSHQKTTSSRWVPQTGIEPVLPFRATGF